MTCMMPLNDSTNIARDPSAQTNQIRACILRLRKPKAASKDRNKRSTQRESRRQRAATHRAARSWGEPVKTSNKVLTICVAWKIAVHHNRGASFPYPRPSVAGPPPSADSRLSDGDAFRRRCAYKATGTESEQAPQLNRLRWG